MSDPSSGDLSPARPSKNNTLLIVVLVAAAFCSLIVLAALGAGAYVLLQRNGAFARARPPRPAESLAEKQRANAEAFGAAAESDASPQEIEDLMALFNRVARIKTPQQTEECFDIDRLYQEVAAASRDPKFFLAPGAKEGFHKSFAEKFTKSPLVGSSVSVKVKRVKYLGGRDDAVVFSQHRDADGDGTKMRWWVVRSGGRWKIYDFEDLEMGMRSSITMASVVDASGPQGVLPRQSEAIAAVNTATSLLASQQYDQAEQQILPTLDVLLPKEYAAWRLAQLAIIQTSRGEWGKALDFADRAAVVNPEMPLLPMLRAQILNGFERFEEAAQEARKYIALLGGDDHGSFLLGTALAGMGQKQEAAEAFREGLGNYSDSVDNLVGLAGVLPADALEEVADRFAQFEHPAARLAELAGQLVAEQNSPALAAVLKRNRELSPRDPRNDYYEGELHWMRKEYDEAANSFRSALPQMPESQRVDCQQALRNSLLYAGKPAAAYESMPDGEDTFLAICNHLVTARDPDGLDQVTALHAPRRPDDAWLPYFRGEALVLRGKYDEAAALFRPMLKTELTAGQRDSYQDEYLAAEIKAGRPLSAYQTVPEATDAFLDAANRLLSDGNPDDLEKLLELHAQRKPDDPGLTYFRGEALLMRDKMAEAAAAFESLLGKQLPDIYRQPCQDEYLRSMLNLGKAVEGYRKAPDAATAFKYLADSLADRYNAADDLESLIAAHAERLPDDPWLGYYRGRLLVKRFRYLEAAELLSPLVEAAQDEALKAELAEARREALAFGGKPLEAYSTSLDRDVAFERTAGELVDELDVENLAALVERRKADQADDPALIYYQAQLADMACEYRAVAELLAPAVSSAAEGEERDRLAGMLLDALYRTGGVKTACEVVGPSQAFNFFAVLLANDGDADALDELLAAYEPHAADDPQAAYYRGRLAQFRGRDDEAAEAFSAWFKAAGADEDADEDDDETLETYLEAMADSHQALQAYESASDARSAFFSLARELAWLGDGESLAALVAAHGKREAGDPWLGFWRGHALLMQGQLDEALAAYEALLRDAEAAKQPGISAAAWNECLLIGRPLEAYAASADAVAAFERLGDSLLDDGDLGRLRQLVAAHEAQHADDPCLAWLKAELLIADGKYAEAIELLAPHLADEDSPHAYRYATAHRRAMLKAGRTLDEYQRTEDKREAFRELAAALNQAGDAAQLAALIDAHRESSPQDPWLQYYAAQRLQLERKYDESDRALAAALADPGAAAIRSELVRARRASRFDGGRAVAAYEELGPHLAALNALADSCESHRDAAQLEQLVAAHRQRHPGDVRLRDWELEIADWRGASEELLRLLDEDRSAATRAGSWKLFGMRIGALVRLKRFDDARALLASHERIRPLPYYRALVEAAAGNVPAASAALYALLRNGFGLQSLYEDPDLGPALRSDAFASFRERRPQPPAAAGAHGS